MHIKLAFIFWLVMVAAAIANGYFGQSVVSKIIGDYGSHLYRTFFIIAVIFVFSRAYVLKTKGIGEWYAPAYAGVQWLISSIIFEFIFGHYVFGFSWEKLIAEYRIQEGRLWSLVLASEVIAPLTWAYLINRA